MTGDTFLFCINLFCEQNAADSGVDTVVIMSVCFGVNTPDQLTQTA